jgi:cytochrome c oxidase assembly protein subunit 15
VQVVDASAQPLARLRGIGLSKAALRRVAWVNVAMLIVIVATGATVRLTGSGLGCEHWPGCQVHHFEPTRYHSYVEFGNRIVAFFTILVTLATFGATLLAGATARLRWLALAVFVGTLAQAPLGALTVYSHLNPWLVMTHFALSLVVLALGVTLAIQLMPRPALVTPGLVRLGGAVAGLAATVLVVSGMFATAAGPHPGSTVVRRLWSFEPAVYWHVRATAVFGIVFAALIVWLIRTRSDHLKVALGVLAALAVQMAVGETQYRTHLPWWLVLIHVTLAATVFTAVTAFVVRLWRHPA